MGEFNDGMSSIKSFMVVKLKRILRKFLSNQSIAPNAFPIVANTNSGFTPVKESPSAIEKALGYIQNLINQKMVQANICQTRHMAHNISICPIVHQATLPQPDASSFSNWNFL
jgi:hypothetical protein